MKRDTAPTWAAIAVACLIVAGLMIATPEASWARISAPVTMGALSWVLAIRADRKNR